MAFNRVLPRVTPVLVLMLVSSACGPAAPSTPTPANPDVVTPTNTPTGAEQPLKYREVSSAIPGVMRFSLTTIPDTIDPQQMSFAHEIATGQLVFEGLMELNERLEAVPAAAEKMEVSADGLKYTLTLREGLKYSDGTTLTAQDFDYAWHRLFDPRVPKRKYSSVAYDIVGAQELSTAPLTDTVKIEELMGQLGVKATDDKHLEFTLKQQAAYFPYILTMWMGWPSRKDLVTEGGEKWTTDSTGKYYVGNGPFILKEYNEQGMKFVANPHYRKGKPKLEEVRVQFIKDTAVAFQAYKKGDLDTLAVAAEDLPAIKADPILSKDYYEVPGRCSYYTGFNTRKQPFDNMKLRQAFAQAIDRKDFVDNVLNGLGTPALSLIPPGKPGYAPDIKLWEFSVEGAKKTLAEAGYPNGIGLPEIKLTYPSTARNKVRMEWFQNQIRNNLGIEMPLDPVEPGPYTTLLKDPKTTPQVFVLGWCQDFPDPQNWLTTVFHSTSTLTKVGWKNEEFDTLTRSADKEQDQQKRLDLYHQAQEMLVREAPAVFLYHDMAAGLIKPYVKGAREHASSLDRGLRGFFNVVNIEVSP
jgi:oligopeptide transport system substrate-binding protein